MPNLNGLANKTHNKPLIGGLYVFGGAMTKLAIGFAIIISLICMFLAAAPFTPAVGISFLMLLFTGFIGYKGFLQSSLVLLLINTLAVIGSPGSDISTGNTLIYLPILFIVSFGGVLIGLRKVLSKQTHIKPIK